MRRLSGFVFDTYDDVDGDVLRSIVEDPGRLPPFVKSAARLSEDQIAQTPDDRFALVLFDGTEKLKKYATVDKGNTTLSVLYLVKQAHLMPRPLVKTAARNLIGALNLHGLPVPEELQKLAGDKDDNEKGEKGPGPEKKNLKTAVPGKSTSKPYKPNARVSPINFDELANGPKESHDNPQLGRYDAGREDLNERTNINGTEGSNFMELPAFPQKEKIKTAGATFDSASRQQLPGAQNFFNTQAQVKEQSWRESPYFDVSGWDPSMPIGEERQPERTLLEGSYPIDGYDQVKTASAYFDTNWRDLNFRDRHTYCVKLAARMEELGMEVPEKIARYGSETYAADCDSYVEARRSYVLEDAHDTLDMLIEKRAQVSPGVFAEALAEFDRMNNLNWHWDAQIADPWYSTFGPSIEKVADLDQNWRFDAVGCRINDEDLKTFANNRGERLKSYFGDDIAKEFIKNPRKTFEGLTDEKKLFIARLCQDKYETSF